MHIKYYNAVNRLIKNFTLPSIHVAAIVLPVPRFPANIIYSFDISFLARNFLTLFLSKAALLEIMLIFFLQMFLSLNKTKASLQKFLCCSI